jgi:flagellin-like protein
MSQKIILPKKPQRLKKTVASVKKNPYVRRLVRCKKAVSPVVSNLVLVAVVIVLGFAALMYARTISASYQSDYHSSVTSDIDELKESLAFEQAFYNSTGGSVHIYFINSGRISITIDQVFLSVSNENFTFTMKHMDGALASNNEVSVGAERQVVVAQALPEGSYTVRLVTLRGLSFAYSFVV